jgi:hypothetical protein
LLSSIVIFTLLRSSNLSVYDEHDDLHSRSNLQYNIKDPVNATNLHNDVRYHINNYHNRSHEHNIDEYTHSKRNTSGQISAPSAVAALYAPNATPLSQKQELHAPLLGQNESTGASFISVGAERTHVHSRPNDEHLYRQTYRQPPRQSDRLVHQYNPSTAARTIHHNSKSASADPYVIVDTTLYGGDSPQTHFFTQNNHQNQHNINRGNQAMNISVNNQSHNNVSDHNFQNQSFYRIDCSLDSNSSMSLVPVDYGNVPPIISSTNVNDTRI